LHHLSVGCNPNVRTKGVGLVKQLAKWVLGAAVVVMSVGPSSWAGATTYNPGVAPLASDLVNGVVLGTHLVGGAHTSVAGVGGSGLNATAGTLLDGQRTYIWDQGAQSDLTDGIANRGDAGFAMMIWDMGNAYDSLRLYTHQDHYGEAFSNFWMQDMMEYSVWGSHDGDNFSLLSDVIGFTGTNKTNVTYTFAGTAASIVYRGGSTEFGTLNAYTREYVFSQAYRYYGIRTSQVSLTILGGGVDADPEIDAVGAFNIRNRPVPEPSTWFLLASGLAGLATYRRVKL
jgi:hypothetical protein